jgi:hypothetical protein
MQTITAARIAPSQYALQVGRVEVGTRFEHHTTACGTSTFEVVGEPITVGWCMVTARVREIGGQHDGNEFAAFLTTQS